MKPIVEQHIEEAALEILQDLGYNYTYGPDIAPDSQSPLRNRWDDVILTDKLRDAIARLNPYLTKEEVEEVIKKIKRLSSNQLIHNNEKFHRFLTVGVDLEHRNRLGEISHDYVRLIDFNTLENNEFLAVNQFTIIENNKHRRPDIILFINGLPIAIIELKNPTDEKATIESAHEQLKTYKNEIPTIFNYNELLVISDGTYAQAGTLTSPKEWFLPWKTLDGKEIAKIITTITNFIRRNVQKRDPFRPNKIFCHFFKRKKTNNKNSCWIPSILCNQ